MNSADFMQQIHQTSSAEMDGMVSFEVVSLFTNVPVDAWSFLGLLQLTTAGLDTQE